MLSRVSQNRQEVDQRVVPAAAETLLFEVLFQDIARARLSKTQWK
jgi:hypothetical protein